MGEVLNGYKLLAPFQNRDAGFSRWTTGEQDGKVYFIKEFLNPVYPVDSSLSEQITKEMKMVCSQYVDEKVGIYADINKSGDGNLVRIKEFFRSGSHFYISTDNIADAKYTLEDITKLTVEDKLLICRCLAHTMMGLEKNQIVHGDLKLSNILFHKTDYGKVVGKVIDFDGAFYEYKVPENEDDINCDQVYIAPETLLFICGEDAKLSCKMDVFALGIIFHQIFTGKQPIYDRSNFGVLAEALLNGDMVECEPGVPDSVVPLIHRMLAVLVDSRISMAGVYNQLGQIMNLEDIVEERKTDPTKTASAENEIKKSEPVDGSSFFHQAGSLL